MEPLPSGLTRANAPLDAALVVNSLDSLRHLLDKPNASSDAETPSASEHWEDHAALVTWMAQQLQQRTRADYCLAIGPLPNATANDPRIHLGLASSDGVESVDRQYAGHPTVRLDRAAKQALDLLRRKLI